MSTKIYTGFKAEGISFYELSQQLSEIKQIAQQIAIHRCQRGVFRNRLSSCLLCFQC